MVASSDSNINCEIYEDSRNKGYGDQALLIKGLNNLKKQKQLVLKKSNNVFFFILIY